MGLWKAESCSRFDTCSHYCFPPQVLSKWTQTLGAWKLHLLFTCKMRIMQHWCLIRLRIHHFIELFHDPTWHSTWHTLLMFWCLIKSVFSLRNSSKMYTNSRCMGIIIAIHLYSENHATLMSYCCQNLYIYWTRMWPYLEVSWGGQPHSPRMVGNPLDNVDTPLLRPLSVWQRCCRE